MAPLAEGIILCLNRWSWWERVRICRAWQMCLRFNFLKPWRGRGKPRKKNELLPLWLILLRPALLPMLLIIYVHLSNQTPPGTKGGSSDVNDVGLERLSPIAAVGGMVLMPSASTQHCSSLVLWQQAGWHPSAYTSSVQSELQSGNSHSISGWQHVVVKFR